MSTTSQFFSGGASIKSIQRGTLTILNGSTSGTATISSVTTGKTELRLLGWRSTGTLSTQYFPTIELTNSTTITATGGSTTTADRIVSWELTEWN